MPKRTRKAPRRAGVSLTRAKYKLPTGPVSRTPPIIRSGGRPLPRPTKHGGFKTKSTLPKPKPHGGFKTKGTRLKTAASRRKRR